MKKIGVLIFIVATLSLLPSLTQAACVATGAVTRATLISGFTTVDIRANAPGSPTYRFTTADDTFIQAAIAAELSHANVAVYGNAAACGIVHDGVSAGGVVYQLIVSP